MIAAVQLGRARRSVCSSAVAIVLCIAFLITDRKRRNNPFQAPQNLRVTPPVVA